jgi:Tfp pilus assembly protein PilX
MSAGIIVVIIVAIVVVAALVIGMMAAARRRRLQQRFGPEYDRVVGESDSKRRAEAELTERERRVQDLDIRPLTESARARYAREWAALQEQFVDTPADAVAASQVLVGAVMNERGYPTDNRDQVLADLSVEHAKTLDHYRAAEEISESATAGTASTEDLRQAMIHYRALFRELLGESADAATGPDATSPARDAVADDQVAADQAADDRVASDRVVDDPVSADPALQEPVVSAPASQTAVAADDQADVAADGQADETQRPVTADEPASNGRADIPVQHTPRS